jgi:hypothetical protein
MTGSGAKIAAPVEWAWQGKAPDDRGYRLLASSTGDISAGNFEEILDRFAPGTLEKLPQVAVSYVSASDGSRYLSMAFHEEAAGGLDRLGRDVTFTRFFCVPYRQLAAGPVSYLAMYHAFERIRLPDTAAPPFTADLSRPAPAVPGDAMRALPVAELLLTGNPVCIVDAESTSMAERLAYIDTVMALLPYGMRAEMAAATWASSTYRLHKFRLFFSDAPRRAAESGVDDHVVRWRPDAMLITRAPATRVPEEFGHEYRQWLQPLLEGPSITTELAQETTARAFKTADIDQMLDRIHATQQKRFWSRSPKRRDNVAKNDEVPVRTAPSQDPRQDRRVPNDRVEILIEGIAETLNNPARDPRALGAYTDGLWEALQLGTPPSDESRERYRARIAEHALLRDDLPIPKDRKAGFYKLLLRAAFGKAIGYADYCAIERMLRDKAPDRALLQAIDGMLGADLRALFIVRSSLKKGRHLKSELDATQLLGIATDPQLRADHAGQVWAATITALTDARAAELERVILPLLRDRGFLALELHERAPMDLTFQVSALTDLLKAVYRGPVDRAALPDILAGSPRHYPTLALLLAVCQLLAYEDVDAWLISFLCSLAGSPAVPVDAREGLARLGFQWDALHSDPEETAAGPGEIAPTRLDRTASRTDAVQVLNTLQPADQQPKKQHRIKRMLMPSGQFAVADKKSQSSDDQ